MENIYKEDYLNKIETNRRNKQGIDLIFSLGMKKIDPLCDTLSYSGNEIVSNLVNFDKNKENITAKIIKI